MPPVEQTGIKNLQIRTARQRDTAAVSSLLAELGHPAFPEAVSRHICRAGGHDSPTTVLVADLGGQIVGFMALQCVDALPYQGPWFRITAICVTAAKRGNGIGQMLDAAAIEAARQQGCKRIEVTTNRERIRTHRFYERLGYQDSHRCFTKKLSAPDALKEIRNGNHCSNAPTFIRPIIFT